MDFGEYLRSKRKEKKMSIRQLALYAGCSDSYLSLLERGAAGQRGPSPAFLRKLVVPLGVPYEVLMNAAGYKLQMEDEILYTGSLVLVLRDVLGESLEEFAMRINMKPFEVIGLENQGVSFETFRYILEKLFGKQRVLTSTQKELLFRLEKWFHDSSDTASAGVEQIINILLDHLGENRVNGESSK